MWDLKTKQNKTNKNTNLIDTENKLVVARDGVGGGRRGSKGTNFKL